MSRVARSRGPAASRRRRYGNCPWPPSGRAGVRLVVEDVLRPLGLAARDQLAAHDDAALREADLLADCSMSSHPACQKAGVMTLVQMSRSLKARLSIPRHENPCVSTIWANYSRDQHESAPWYAG